jgi:hypothetical protein
MLLDGICTGTSGVTTFWANNSAVQLKEITNEKCLLNKIIDEV